MKKFLFIVAGISVIVIIFSVVMISVKNNKSSFKTDVSNIEFQDQVSDEDIIADERVDEIKTTEQIKTESKIVLSETTNSKGSDGYWKVGGDVINNDSVKHTVELKATFYGDNGKILDQTIGAVANIEPGEKKSFILSTEHDVNKYFDSTIEIVQVL